MNLRVVLELDEDSVAWSAACPELPGCASAGDSQEEALANIREAIELYLSPGGPAPENSTVVDLTI
jgi:predicted RNase H-like HicB family nuclease